MTSDLLLRVEHRRFRVGCTGGLDEKTALVGLGVSGELGWNADVEWRLRATALALCPEQPLFGVAESDWPTAFLVSTSVSGDAPELSCCWDVGR
ncbi:MAG: hypothetical protein K2Q25_08855 [Mycobacteriaceae bacterium]|nr:hypothetical protein [Mycobacteriaceae bacterium]